MTQVAAGVTTPAPGGATVRLSSPDPSTRTPERTILSVTDHAFARVQGTRGDRQAGTTTARRVRCETGGLAAVDRIPTSHARVRARDDRGFTVLESIAAATILLLVAAGVITVLVTTSSWYARARLRTEANAVANQVMSLVLSRNYTAIENSSDEDATWPEDIPATISQGSSVGTFTVDIAIDGSLVATATGLPIKEVVVTASPLVQPPGAPVSVSVTRLASDSKNGLGSEGATVTVQVQLKTRAPGRTNLENLQQSGARVQLLYAHESPDQGLGFWAITDPNGIATFDSVPESKVATSTGYFLTSDPRFGTDVRPLHFPKRVYPTRLGGANPVVKYSLEVVRHNTAAVLRVGGFQTEGFYGATFVFGRYNWLIEKPYRRVVGADGTRLRIYAVPILNTAEMAGRTAGTKSIYPETTQLGPYSAEVNDYGIARIEVPWTVDPGIGQSWLVWCRTADPATGQPVLHTMTLKAPGGWDVPVDQADLMDQPLASGVAQFTGLGNVEPINSAVRP